MNRELLFSVTKDDFDFQTFRSGGKGGQHQNKKDTGVRIIHRESGAVGESREERSQTQNKKNAFNRLVQSKKFQDWLKIKTADCLGIQAKVKEEINRKVDYWMREEFRIVEAIDPETGEFVQINENDLKE